MYGVRRHVDRIDVCGASFIVTSSDTGLADSLFIVTIFNNELRINTNNTKMRRICLI